MALAGRVGRVLVVAAVLVAFWQGIVWAYDMPVFLLPGPGRVAEVLLAQAPSLAGDALITFGEVLAGFTLGTGLGATLALAMVARPALARALMPVLLFSQAIPFFALAPILVLWFGLGIGSKIAMAVIFIFFPVTSAFYDGLRRTDPALLDLAAVMGARPGRVLWHLRVPAAMPACASGLRLAAVYAPIGAVIGEWVGGAQGGLGYQMLLANGRSKIDLMFAALIVLALGVVAVYAAVDRLARAMEAWAEGR
ncbi:MAG: ABC transporter permease [Pseudomonadota bacterium]